VWLPVVTRATGMRSTISVAGTRQRGVAASARAAASEQHAAAARSSSGNQGVPCSACF
jgi:hypothetical protein